MKNSHLLLSVLFFINIACSKDDLSSNNQIQDNEAPTVNQEIEVIQNSINSNVIVTVKDSDGNLIEDAKVVITNNEGYTENGFISFYDIIINEKFNGVQVSKDGYISTVKSFSPTEAKNNSITVTLFEGETKSIETTEGGEITFGNNISLDFPTDAFINSNGSTFNGSANIKLQYHHPNQDNYQDSVPGTLVGLSENGTYSALATEGMISVDLEDSNGNTLEIANDKIITVKMPADNDSPENIKLWHLDENSGIWTETGSAYKNGNYYEFEVSHFSSYNLDYNVDAVEKVIFSVYDDIRVLSNQLLNVYVNNEFVEQITTDANGLFTLYWAPIGEYTLQPILCDGQVSSNTVNVQNSGFYKALVPSFRDFTEGIAFNFSFSGIIKNCSNYFEDDEFVNFTINKGLASENRFTLSLDNTGYFYYNNSSCVDISTSIISSEVTYEDETIEANFTNIVRTSYELEAFNFCNNPELLYGTPIDIAPDLYEAIHSELQLNENEVITSELAFQLKKIREYFDFWFIENLDIKDISDNFPNLEELTIALPSNTAENLEYVSELTQLKKLYIDAGSSLNNLSLISNLTNLEQLDLDINNNVDLTDLENLTNLKVISFFGNDNYINDISSISELNNLERIYINYTTVTNLSALENLTNLVEVSVIYSPVSNISGIENLINLENLTIRDANISSIESVSNLSNLISINISNNNITDISHISNLNKLEVFSAYNNQITDGIDVFLNLENIQRITLQGNPVSDEDVNELRALLPDCLIIH